MDRCPVCNANVHKKPVCRRCKTDLSMLITIEGEAARHTEQARRAFQSNDFNRMFFHAKRACSLRTTPESLVLHATSAILTRRFDVALGLWKRYGTRQHPLK